MGGNWYVTSYNWTPELINENYLYQIMNINYKPHSYVDLAHDRISIV